jgi:Fe-S-cluster containining protein
MEQTELVVLPQAARYSCHQCGNCCSRYTVCIDRATHERLSAVDWSQYGERLKGRPLFIPLDAAKAEGSYSHELARIGARCIFLEDDNCCLIHSVMGAHAKPLMCRKFPYNFVRTPDGVNVSLDLFCPSALGQKGDPIENHLPDIHGLLTEVSEVATLPAEGLLFLDQTLNWRDYVEVENALLALLLREDATLEARLIAGTSLILRVCQAQLKAKMASQPAPPVTQTLSEISKDELLARAAKTPAAPLVHRLYIGVTLAAFESMAADVRGEKPLGFGARVRLLRGSGRVKLWTLNGQAVSLHDLSKIPFDTTQTEMHALLQRWLISKLESRTVVPLTTLVRGWHHFLGHFLWARWFSRAMASLRDSRVVARDDLFEGIQLTEMAARTLAPKPGVKSFGKFLDLVYDSPKFVPAAVADSKT